jgi:anti-sigma regulatory factor (Ser/Thr protein kinase)
MQGMQRAMSFRHEALFYAGRDDFVRRTAAFLRDAVEAEEPTLVVVDATKIDLLREELDGAAHGIQFADMAAVGANPARIIPAWREFVTRHAPIGRRLRGIGEPIWPERTAAELVECERHESLLNLAFTGSPSWWLVCPYDTEALDPAVVEEARRTHPFVLEDGVARPSDDYYGLNRIAAPFDEPLPEPPAAAQELPFGDGPLDALRWYVARRGVEAGFGGSRLADLVLAVHELATNSLRHGGGRGTLRVWREPDALVCEVADSGRIDDPLVGRERPLGAQRDGRGLWLVNQLCDLAQIRSFPTGSVVRAHMRLGS